MTTDEERRSAKTGKTKTQTTTDKVSGHIKQLTMYGNRGNMNVDTNPGRGELVIDHHLPGAVTNYGGKKLQKTVNKVTENLKNWVRKKPESRE